MDRKIERAQLHLAFEKCKELSKKNYTRFVYNVSTARNMLTTDWQISHFHAWLANPHGYNEQTVDLCEAIRTPMEIIPYADHMVVDTYQNGPNETIIHVRNTHFGTKVSQEDEKCPL